MVATIVHPAALTPFQIAVILVPRSHLLLYLDMSKYDRRVVEKLYNVGNSFDQSLWITLTVPDEHINYTPIVPRQKEKP